MDADEPGQHAVDHEDQDGDVPEPVEGHALSQDEPGHQEHGGHAENVGGEPVVLHGGLVADVGGAPVVDLLCLSGGIAEGDARHVDVGIGVSPDQVPEAVAAAAAVVASSAQLGAASLRVADEQLHDESWDGEEGIQE